MAKSRIEDIVYPLAQPIAEKNGCELVDIEFKKESNNWFLRIFIDKEEGVTIDDCEAVSKEISDELDRVDPIQHSYFLEVSSPGLDRPLKKEKDFIKNIGRRIEVKLYKAINGAKLLTGVLEGYKDGDIIMTLDSGERLELEKKKIALVRLAIDF
ncbi:MAG: ribosome maturation factor RimP [Clostridiaceae bacterium]|nr:ribosome maturation factor RimP [Clostridiaceae bacterium]